jgi:endogenous inhibitor of DNA gyrase (YacG/DUF329 family)
MPCHIGALVNCPHCGKALRAIEIIYESKVNPVSGLVIANADKVKVGERPARNRYAPFCTLRCGWAYGRWYYNKGKKKHG